MRRTQHVGSSEDLRCFGKRLGKPGGRRRQGDPRRTSGIRILLDRRAGASSLCASPSSPAATSAPAARYGLAAPSTDFHSTLADSVEAPLAPSSRSAASRFSLPQQAYAPAQCPGWRRAYESALGTPIAVSAGSCPSAPAMNARPPGAVPSVPSPPASRFTPSRQMLMWNVRSVPDRAGDDSRREARPPAVACRQPCGSSGARESIRRRPGAGSVGGSESSICPFAYSGWICSGDDARLGQGIDQVEHERPGVAECRRSVARPAVKRHEVPGLLPARPTTRAPRRPSPRRPRPRPGAGPGARSPAGSPATARPIARSGRSARRPNRARRRRARPRRGQPAGEGLRTGCRGRGRARMSRPRATGPRCSTSRCRARPRGRACRSARISSRARPALSTRTSPTIRTPASRSSSGVIGCASPAGERGELGVVEPARLDIGKSVFEDAERLVDLGPRRSSSGGVSSTTLPASPA